MDGQSEKHTAHAHVSSSRATSLRNNACCGTIMKIMDGTKIRNFRMERRRKKKKKGKFPTFQLIRLITARSSNNFRSYYFHRFRTNCRQEQSVNFINSHFDRPISPNIYIYIILIFPCWNVRVYI